MAETPDDRLARLYRRYLGEPERELDVYAGFALFFGGIALGLVALVVLSVAQIATGEAFLLREVAFSLAALALPTTMLGISVLLPVDRRATYAAVVGLVVTVAAVAFFVSVYPSQWNVAGNDYSLQGILLYSAGLIVTTAATGAALVSYHVERARGGPADADEEADLAEDEVDEEAVAEAARRDYEEAMADVDVSWGGVEKTEVSHRLSIAESEEIDASGMQGVGTEERRDRGDRVEDAVAGLQSLRGEGPKTDTGGGTDDQAAALRELREQKETQTVAEEPGLLDRLKRWLGID